MLSEALLSALRAPSDLPLQQQLAEALRQLLRRGELQPGQRLPGTRELAGDLGVGRNTVIHAYERLVQQGYLCARPGSGMFVAPQLPLYELPAPRVEQGHAPPRSGLSQRALQLLALPEILTGSAFGHCTPDLTHLRLDLWHALLAKQERQLRGSELQYAPPGGHPRLREAIAAHVTLTRQVVCEPEQVVVVNGAQQGLDLCLRLLADVGDPIWLENPGYPGAQRAVALAGLQPVPVEVDEDGLRPEPGLPAPRLVAVTPSHQFPTGVLMSLERRQALLALARQHDAWVIEDDYDGEFRLSGAPVPSLQGLDGGQRVVYVGSFSKVLFPALRLGYVILPRAIAAPFAEAAAQALLEGRLGVQAALAEFMAQGHLADHVRRMRQVYAARRAQLVELWQAELGDAVPLSGATTGMQILAELPVGLPERVAREAAAWDIRVQTLATFTTGPLRRDGLVLGYGGTHERELALKGRQLARLVARALNRPRL